MNASRPPIDKILPVLRQQWSHFQVKRAWLFGSPSADLEQATSDWDFLVEFSKPPSFDAFMGLKSSLEEGLRGRVDLLSRSACQPRFLKAIENHLIDVT